MSHGAAVSLSQREEIRRRGRRLGFARVGFTTTARTRRGAEAFDTWLAHGYHGRMAYLAEQGDRASPTSLLAEARSVIVAALPYPTEGPSSAVPARSSPGDEPWLGIVARYARGADYHIVLRRLLTALAQDCSDVLGRALVARPCVDTAPLLERELAVRAGVAFMGKSNLAIVPGVGSYVLLGELLVAESIPPDEPARPRCGTCRLCLDACPTGALAAAHLLDARRCVSYLTVEHPGTIPADLRPHIGTRIFGCDACQQACPFNASGKPRPCCAELAPHPRLDGPRLTDLLTQGSAAYRRLVKDTALRRTSRPRLARNAAIALGNSGDPRAGAALARALREHASPLVRGHAAWALGRVAPDAAALRHAATRDEDPQVRAEASSALRGLSNRI